MRADFDVFVSFAWADIDPKLDPLSTPEWFGTEKPILYERFVGRFAEM